MAILVVKIEKGGFEGVFTDDKGLENMPVIIMDEDADDEEPVMASDDVVVFDPDEVKRAEECLEMDVEGGIREEGLDNVDGGMRG